MALPDDYFEYGKNDLQPSTAMMPETPLRISVFLQDLYGGGAEHVMLLLAAGMAQRGHVVDLVLVRRQGSFVDDIPPNVRVVELEHGAPSTACWHSPAISGRNGRMSS